MATIRNLTSQGDLRSVKFCRYISIERLADLVNGKTFVPSFNKLQERSDALELGIPPLANPYLVNHMFNYPDFESAKGWLIRCWEAEYQSTFREIGDLAERLLMTQWFKELAIRRCCWCWFCTKDGIEESLAMWKLYAEYGVLIRSTFERIDRSTDLTDYEAALFEVEYVHPEEFDEAFATMDNLRRPFIFKSKSYRCESEMRIVFEKGGTVVYPGITLDVQGVDLIREIILSPFLSSDNEAEIKELVKNSPCNGVPIFKSSSAANHPSGSPPTNAYLRFCHSETNRPTIVCDL